MNTESDKPPKQSVNPEQNKDQKILQHIDETLSEYEKYLALDHKLAMEGLAIEIEKRRREQNGYDEPPKPKTAN